ncbi:MAG: hypothetical protein U1G07_21770 [Verrucomicrobiota bacterium]
MGIRVFNVSEAFARFTALIGAVVLASAADVPSADRLFIEKHCAECHDAETAKGGLNLSALALTRLT